MFIFSKRFFPLVILSLTIISGCDMSVQNSSEEIPENTVDIFVQPGEPLIFLESDGDKICRRGLPDESIYGLDPEEKTEQEEESAEEGPGGTETESDSAQTPDIISTQVDKNWFEFGLLIVNKSKSYHLIVRELQFKITATWGDDILSSTANIGSGYCSSSPLYIIPPTPEGSKNSYTGDKYEPFKQNYVNNLTLFVSGVPIPEGPPTYKEKEGDTNSAVDTIRREGQDATRTAEQTEVFVLTYLPTYRVQLIAHGYWIDKSRNMVANFRKSIRFSLSSQFLN